MPEDDVTGKPVGDCHWLVSVLSVTFTALTLLIQSKFINHNRTFIPYFDVSIPSRLRRIEYQLILMKISWRDRNVKIRYKCLLVTDEFLTVSWYQPNEFISRNLTLLVGWQAVHLVAVKISTVILNSARNWWRNSSTNKPDSHEKWLQQCVNGNAE